jgi:phosphocarrier protein HPr
MLERHLRIINPLGLHARAAAQLVRQAGRFSSAITLVRDDTGISADAKSILSVLQLAAAYGIVLRVAVDGTDEGEAIMAMERLFLEGFGEI